MVLIAGISRNLFGWLAHLETCWKAKFEISNFEKILSKVRVVVGARVSSLVLGNALGIYRV